MNRNSALQRIDDERGWTVIELMIVLLIIGILLGIAVAVYASASGTASAAVCRNNQQVLNRAIGVARASDVEVDEISDLETFVVDFGNTSKCPSDGTLLEYDTATDSIVCPNHPQ